MPKNSILNINNLRKIYHTKQGETLAVDNFSFSLHEGEFVSIVGPSGCGKSTILSILCGLEQKSGGSITLKDGLKLGYMLQEDCLLPWKNILENCLLGLKIKGKVSDNDFEYVNYLLDTYGLKEFKYSYPNNLSGGMKQRVALIRTLAMKPDILLLDEPFSALDYTSRLAISDDIYRILRKEKKSILMVTHDIAEAISMSDRVVLLSKRPSTIKHTYDIKLTNGSTPIENRQAKEFSSYYEKIWKEMDYYV